MNCAHYELTLMRMARNELLDTALRNEAELHMSECPSCKLSYSRQIDLSRQLQELALEPVTALNGKLGQNLLAAYKASRRRKHQPWIWAGKAAAIATLVLIGWLAFQEFPPQTPDPSTRSEENSIYTDFFPIVHGVLPSEELFLVRVQVPRSSLLQFGVPVNTDRTEEVVVADIVMGEEGIPHAIRLVGDNTR